MKRLFSALAAASVLAAIPAVHAETADRSKPISINANRFDGDELGQVATYTGNVEVHQGTLEILGDKLQLKVSPEGYRTLTVTGNPVRMKEKRDTKTKGIEEWVHASGLTAVYDERRDKITFRDVAKLARSENGLVKDSTAGDVIEYDLLRAKSLVKGSTVDGKPTRVTTVLAPRQKKTQTQSAKGKSQNSANAKPKNNTLNTKKAAPMTKSTRLN